MHSDARIRYCHSAQKCICGIDDPVCRAIKRQSKGCAYFIRENLIRHIYCRSTVGARGEHCGVRIGDVQFPQLAAKLRHTGGEIELPIDLGKRTWGRTASANVDVLDHDGSCGCPVRLPEFAAVRSVVSTEVERSEDIGQILWVQSTLNKHGPCGTAIGNPKIGATREEHFPAHGCERVDHSADTGDSNSSAGRAVASP